MGKILSFEERLLRHVDIDGDCWIWHGSTTPRYGQLRVDNRNIVAHRWVWENLVGPIADGLVLDHYACRRTLCVNPDHLEPVTPLENFLRSHAVTRINRDKTHCSRGHLLDGENTYRRPDGYRDCKICVNRRSRERNARRRAA